MSAKKAFKIGQVVQVHEFGFGQITKELSGEEWEVTFWDFDQGDRWSWMYHQTTLKPLNARQRGVR